MSCIPSSTRDLRTIQTGRRYSPESSSGAYPVAGTQRRMVGPQGRNRFLDTRTRRHRDVGRPRPGTDQWASRPQRVTAMIQYAVMIDFRLGVSESARRRCVTRLPELADLVPGLASWRVRTNLTSTTRARPHAARTRGDGRPAEGSESRTCRTPPRAYDGLIRAGRRSAGSTIMLSRPGGTVSDNNYVGEQRLAAATTL